MSDINSQIEEYTRRGKYRELISLLEQEISITESLEDKYDYKLQIAEACYNLREFSKAKKMGEELLSLAQGGENLVLIGNLENLLGKIYRIHQRYEEALKHYQNAKKSFKLAEYNSGLSKIYHNIGNVHVFRGKFKEALKNHKIALELAEKEGKDEAIASSFLNIGSTHYQNGQIDEALEYFLKAKDIFEKIQDEPSIAAIYLNLAEVKLLRRDYKTAKDYSTKSRDLYEKLQNVIGLKLALTSLGATEKSSGLFTEAIDTFKRLIELNGKNTKEDTFFELGSCYLSTNQNFKAKETYEKILELPSRTPQGIGFSLDHLARIAIEMKDYDEAKAIYSQLLSVLRNMQPRDDDSICSTQANLGFVLLKNGNFEEAWKLLETCATFFTKKKNYEDLNSLTNNYRDYLISIDDYQHSIEIVENYIIPTAKKISKEKKKMNLYYYEVALLQYMMGKTEVALNYWKKKQNKKKFQKLNPSFLNSLILEESKRKDLQRKHLTFLKQIQDDKKSGITK